MVHLRRRVLPCLLVLLVTLPQWTADRETEGDAVEVHFELKLLLRQRRWIGRLALDQWAAGRLLGTWSSAGGGARRFSLVRPLEDPWTFRWYPTKHEVKLGAAVWVDRARGDVYDTLARRLEPRAREAYAGWWDADRVRDTGLPQPDWAGLARRFWARRHRTEVQEKDPLHADPTYPFYVLGPAQGRLTFTVEPGGRLRPDSVVETMTEPWLPHGWEESLAGRTRSGYGFWETERPRWEPRTYEALASALALLGWTCAEGKSTEALPSLTAAVVETLVPWAEGRFAWETPVRLTCEAERADDGTTTRVARGEQRLEGSPPLRYRVWRAWRFSAGRRLVADEVQVLVQDEEERLKLWVRVGYGPPVRERQRSSIASSTLR